VNDAIQKNHSVSSISLWYEVAYMEAKGRMHRGNTILMIGVWFRV
jgi:hypothetical protein